MKVFIVACPGLKKEENEEGRKRREIKVIRETHSTSRCLESKGSENQTEEASAGGTQLGIGSIAGLSGAGLSGATRGATSSVGTRGGG